MAKSAKNTEPTIGQRIVRGLKEFSEAIERGEDIEQRFKCRTYRLNLQPRDYDATLVAETRGLLGVSQDVFAGFLGVATTTVESWESDASTPDGSACRLMDEIRRDPDYWQDRLRELAEPVGA